MMSIGIELNYINKRLKKLFLLQKHFIQITHFYFYLIMQLIILFTQKTLFKLRIWTKDLKESNQYYMMDGLIKMVFRLFILWIFNNKMSNRYKKTSKKC